MNIRLVFKSTGLLLICEAIAMIPSVIVSLIYLEHIGLVFLDTIGIILCFAVPLCLIQIKKKNMYARDGFAIVALGWILMSVFGALPFYLSGAIPSFIDAFLKQAQALPLPEPVY